MLIHIHCIIIGGNLEFTCNARSHNCNETKPLGTISRIPEPTSFSILSFKKTPVPHINYHYDYQKIMPCKKTQ